MERSPVPLYLLLSTREDALERVRWRLIRESHSQERSRVRRFGKLMFSVVWPVVSAIRAVSSTRAHAKTLTSVFERPIWEVFFRQWAAAVWFGLPPALFVKNASALASVPRSARLILTNQERAYIVDALVSKRAQASLADKFIFHQICVTAGLPCIPILYRFKDGNIERVSAYPENSAAATGFFAKPAADQHGHGAMAWSAVDGNHYLATDGQRQTLQEILEILQERSRSGSTYLLQPRISNHDSIRDLSPGALSAVRLLTARRTRGEVVPLIAYLRMSTGGAITDNLSAGGLAAAIDLGNGILGTATDKSTSPVRYTDHPETGKEIVGRTVPTWPAVIELAREAHGVFSDYPLVGWDIAITPEGPCLIEGNEHPGVDIAQFITATPLGSTALPEIVEEWFSARQNTLRAGSARSRVDS